MRNKRILIFIDNEICFRHFVLNDTFQDICKKNKVIFVLPEEKNKKIKSINPNKNYFNSEVVRLAEDSYRVRCWKYLLYIGQIRKNKSSKNSIFLILVVFSF